MTSQTSKDVLQTIFSQKQIEDNLEKIQTEKKNLVTLVKDIQIERAAVHEV